MSSRMYSVVYHGNTIETTVTNKASVAQKWLQNIIKSLKQQPGVNSNIIGIGCKYILHPIRSMSNKVALLQLCVGNKCLVLQLQHMGRIPDNFKHFLRALNATFVGIEVHENLQKLSREYSIEVQRKVDVRFLARTWFPFSCKGNPSLKSLAYVLLGFPMRKSKDYEGDWESRVLDKELVEEACVDVFASYSIACKLLKDG